MKTLACIAAATALALPAAAQDSFANRPTIVVTGNGQASAQPDTFRVDAGVRGRGANQQEALRALAAAQGRLIEAWPKLEGLQRGRVTTGDIALDTLHDPDCEENARRDEECPILAYFATSALTLEGVPAERAGDAISLASELGATTARLDEYSLSNSDDLRAQANRAAFADAEAQAARLSEVSGRRLVRILRIQDPTAPRSDYDAQEIDEVVVTGSRIRQAVSIAVAPEPVEATARVFVVFEIE
ncbi:MAG TPA: SIMPL domain-containing protein [Brevundimonas sp.]|jgi:hypothetical protein